MKEFGSKTEALGYAFNSYRHALKGRLRAEIQVPHIMREIRSAMEEIEQQGYHLSDEQRRTIDAFDPGAKALAETDVSQLGIGQKKFDELSETTSIPTKSIPTLLRRGELNERDVARIQSKARTVEEETRKRLVETLLYAIGVKKL